MEYYSLSVGLFGPVVDMLEFARSLLYLEGKDGGKKKESVIIYCTGYFNFTRDHMLKISTIHLLSFSFAS